jgi:Zn-finger nucleic acid-binding protein
MAGHEIMPDDQYFLREDLEKLKDIRARQDVLRQKQADEQRRMAHWMKCPKCGAELKETVFREVIIDVCPTCRGVWLNQGELEMLLGMKETTIGRFMKMMQLDLNYGPVNDAPGGLETK